jgi:hypothetical protein
MTAAGAGDTQGRCAGLDRETGSGSVVKAAAPGVERDEAWASVNRSSLRSQRRDRARGATAGGRGRPTTEDAAKPLVFGSRDRDVQNPQPRASMLSAGHAAPPITDHGDFRCNTF